MDLKQLNTKAACNQEVEFNLLHPATGEPLEAEVPGCDEPQPVLIKIVGGESDQMRDFERGRDASLSAVFAKNRKDRELDNIEKAIAATVGWSNFVFNGEVLEFNQTNLEKIYKKEGFEWISSQVNGRVGNLELFMKG